MFSVFEAAAQIQIILHTPQVYVGGVVTGVVILKVVKDSVDGNSVVLTFFCKEDTRADYTSSSTDSEGRSETTQHSTHQSNVVVSINLGLASSTTGSFAQGQYEFPFSFQLRPDLPPTMSANMGGSEGGACAINYSLFARLERATGLFKHKIENIVPFIVLPVLTPSDAPRSPVVVGPLSQNAVFCCCFSRGKFDLGIASPSNWFVPNEALEVSYVLQNDSHARVEKILIGFYQRTNWLANGYSRYELKPIQIQPPGVSGSDFPPLRKQSGQLPISMNELQRNLVNGTYKCPITIPSYSYASYRGQLINVTHSLVLTIVTPGGTSNPTIECPISIAWKFPPGAAVAQNNAIQGQVVEVQGTLLNKTNPIGQYNPGSVVPVVEAYAVPVDGTSSSAGYQQVPTAENVTLTYQSNPSALPAGGGFQEWITNFKSSYNQVQDARNCPNHVMESLTTGQFTEIFSSIRSSFDSVAIAEIIASRRSSITCEQILAAVSVSSSLVKVDMVRRFAVKCTDKQNYAILRSGSEFEYLECTKILQA